MNEVWWIITILTGLSGLANIYEAGKGDYSKFNYANTSLVAGLINCILSLWALYTLVVVG